jgi:hypothetical protein
MTAPLNVDLRALREELGLSEQPDLRSHQFLRFINRLCEALDDDIPEHEWPRLISTREAFEYLYARAQTRVAL